MPSTLHPDPRSNQTELAPSAEGTRFERALVFLTVPAVALGYFVCVAVLRCVGHRD